MSLCYELLKVASLNYTSPEELARKMAPAAKTEGGISENVVSIVGRKLFERGFMEFESGNGTFGRAMRITEAGQELRAIYGLDMLKGKEHYKNAIILDEHFEELG